MKHFQSWRLPIFTLLLAAAPLQFAEAARMVLPTPIAIPESVEDVRIPIYRGASNVNWQIEEERENAFLASTFVRGKHLAKVWIVVGKSQLFFEYGGSRNLDCVPNGSSCSRIHRAYNQWATALAQSISQEFIASRYGTVISRSSKVPNSTQEATPAAPKSAGTCFAVTKNGDLITNLHVVNGYKNIRVTLANGISTSADLKSYSVVNDIALLKISVSTPNYLSFASSETIDVGEQVFTIGYPAVKILGEEPKFTDGVVSSLSGLVGEASWVQITVPIQPGNSGGPLLDKYGRVVGIVNASVAELPFFRAVGSLPQNVSWAIKADFAQPLFSRPEPRAFDSREDAIKHASKSICRIDAAN